MRIRKVTAHAFGPLVSETLEFADGMTVVVGDNESAKSSWHAAVYAALCGQRRGRGRPRELEQRFVDLHKPWDRYEWLVSAEVVLDDGHRIELRQDLVGKVDCHARDLDIGADISAEIMNDGAPDGARWLGLDRSSFLATACVEQAQVTRVLDGAGGLQQHLQRAAATAGAKATAASALRLLEDFDREHVGTERLNSTKPLRRAMNSVASCEARLTNANRAHAEYLHLAEKADALRGEAASADATLRAHEANAALHEADQLAEHARRADELAAALGDAPAAPAAKDDALARQVTEALTCWRGQPPEPSLTGPTAAQLQEQIAALPPMPEGDLEAHASVTQAQDRLGRAVAQLEQHDSDRPAVPEATYAAESATDQELMDLALVLERPEPTVDPALETAVVAARRELAASAGRFRIANVVLAAAVVLLIGGAVLLAGRKTDAGAVAIAAAIVLAGFGIARHGSRAGDAVRRRQVEAEAKLDSARRQVADAQQRRARAIRQCSELGLTEDAGTIRQAVTDRARSVSYRQDTDGWQRRHSELEKQLSMATAELASALTARGHPAISQVANDLAVAAGEYRQDCARRAAQAREASRRGDLTDQLAVRQQQERRADDDRQERDHAARLVAEAGAACKLTLGPVAMMATGLEQWLKRRAENVEQADASRGQQAELDALLNGRALQEIAEEAQAAARDAQVLAAGIDSGLLAMTDQATAVERLPGLREEAREASNMAADAAGDLRRFASSVPSVAEAEEALDDARAELGRVRGLQGTLALTRRFLEDAQDRAHRDIAPVLAATVREWLPGITDGRYTDVTVNPSSLKVEVCGPSRRWRVAERLSYGTAEQIYLMLRVALADHLTKSHDTCPLILDDVTVHADSARTHNILALLLKIAEQRQVILFTQETRVADWACEHLNSPEHALRTLPPLPAE